MVKSIKIGYNEKENIITSTIKLAKDGKSGDCKKIFGIMGLAVKNGQEVTLTFEGEDEEAAYEAVSQFMKENM